MLSCIKVNAYYTVTTLHSVVFCVWCKTSVRVFARDYTVYCCTADGTVTVNRHIHVGHFFHLITMCDFSCCKSEMGGVLSSITPRTPLLLFVYACHNFKIPLDRSNNPEIGR